MTVNTKIKNKIDFKKKHQNCAAAHSGMCAAWQGCPWHWQSRARFKIAKQHLQRMRYSLNPSGSPATCSKERGRLDCALATSRLDSQHRHTRATAELPIA